MNRLRDYYGFTRMPFGRDLPPSALFRSAAHSEAVARLTWLIEERGLGILTGEVGAGKTVAARATVAGLEPSRYQAVYCTNPTIGGRGLLSLLVAALGGPPYTHRAVLVPQASEVLATAEAERGRRVVFIVDEGHLLVPEQLEDLRMLTSAEMDSRSPAAVLLIGQPTLRRRLHQGSLAAIDQRVTLRVHLDGMVIHQASRGLPRAINNLALQS